VVIGPECWRFGQIVTSIACPRPIKQSGDRWVATSQFLQTALKELTMGTAQYNRILDIAERICTALVAGRDDDPVRIQEILFALPLSVAYFVAVTLQSHKRDDQLAAAAAMLQQLGRNFLAASEDEASLARIFECGDIAPNASALH
jgi:hypothetical protein